GNPLRWRDPFGEATEKECTDAVKQLQGEKWYQELVKQFKAAKKKMPEIKCVKESDDVEPGTIGGYSSRTNTVTIVYERGKANHLKRTLVHELVHAFNQWFL